MTNFESILKIDETAQISPRASIAAPGVIEACVMVGPGVHIAPGVLLMEDSVICPNDVQSVSSNGRIIEGNVSVGPDVLLHDEIELGYGAIIPTQDSIAHIGSFGDKNRVITVYGSDLGPRYSLGCHVGVGFGRLKEQIRRAYHTSNDSAASYKPYLGVFDHMGSIVQRAYEVDRNLVTEIEEQRDAYGLAVVELPQLD